MTSSNRLVALMALVALQSLPVPAFGGTPRTPVVTLDAGHGGPDPGAVNCHYSFAGKACLQESDVNLDMVLRTKHLLRRAGLRVRPTRKGDTRVNRPAQDIATWNLEPGGDYRFYADGVVDQRDELQARVNVANCGRPGSSCSTESNRTSDAFVSVHNNACGGCEADGTTTFYYHFGSRRLASLIQREVTKRTSQTSRGLAVAAFYVIRWTRMPGALLEAGFIDNNREARRLMRARFRRRVARGIEVGVLEYLCTAVGTAGADELHGTARRDVLCGRAGDDIIKGAEAGDVILGGPENDVLRGGAGHDALIGGPGADVCAQGRGTGRTISCSP
jgi:N-acetylmuramoyl-L-alanine amidase